jgi:hypothetical protein
MNDIDPEVIRAILQGGAESGQLDPEIEQLKELIAQLREQGSPAQGRTVRNGIYVADSPLKHLAGAGANILGGMKGREMMGMQKQQAGIRSQQNSSVLDALLRQSPSSQSGHQNFPWFGTTGE